jgi:class 3 adenylate cyclase/predicted ATPase
MVKRYLPENLIEKIMAQKDKLAGERKQVTVMFCDMKGFTALSEELGPEKAYSIMDQVYAILIRGVHNYEGTVNELTGDGVMALFGAPIAVEDAPQRAIRSAVDIHRAMFKLSEQCRLDGTMRFPVKMRIGIHTGPVVVGSLGSDLRVEFKAVGDTVNLASRMESAAEPGTTYVTEETFKLTEGLFRFEALGVRKVKGRRDPVGMYRVIAPSTGRTRFDVSAERGLTPFVGRERELELLLDGFERSKRGRGQAFSIIAEAGVGKSRLLYEFRKAVIGEDATFLEGKCLSYSRGVAYHPIIDILKAHFEVRGSEDGAEIRSKVEEGLKTLGVEEAFTLPYILELLSVEESGIGSIPISAEEKKIRIVEAAKRIVLKSSELRPLILAIEDLHWVDNSSEEALKELLNSISGARILLLFTYRPEFVHSWGSRSYHGQINLNRFSNRESLIMVTHLLGEGDIDGDLEEFILERTEGVPFFIEEFVKSLKDLKVVAKRDNRFVAVKNLHDVALPTTIQEVIMARVDSLPEEAKKLLQMGSVIGREFDYNLISEVTGLDEQELLFRLSILKDAELIYERGIYPHSTCIFKHALTQDAAYQSLLSAVRKKYHATVASELEEHFPEKTWTQPEILARHFTEASLFERAVPYWRIAGEIAIRRSAHVEAADHFSRGLELLKTLPETTENLKQELALQIALYAPLAGAKGYGAPEVDSAYNRARELCEKVGEPSQLFLVLYGLWGHNFVLGKLKMVPKLAEQCLGVAQDIRDPALIMEACRMVAETALYRGDLEKAREYWEQSYALYDPEKHRIHAEVYGQDPGVALLSHGAQILWGLGYLDQAKKRADEALLLARDHAHPFSIAFALFLGTVVYQWRREVRIAQERIEEVIHLSEKHGFPFWQAVAIPLRGWVQVMQGQVKKGIEIIHRGLDDSRERGVELFRAYHLTILADAYRVAGSVEDGLKTVDEALAATDETEVRYCESELHRIRGELLQTRGAPEPEVGSCFQRALEIARLQRARSMELRSTVSLCRLWGKQGRKDEARRRLSEAYDWFTEGFDTPDLREAKALLEELG